MTDLLARPKAPVAAPRGTGGSGVWRHRVIQVLSVLAAIGLWQVLTANGVRLWLRFDTLPTVTEIGSALAHRLGTGEYWLDLGPSLIRILTGFGLAAVAEEWQQLGFGAAAADAARQVEELVPDHGEAPQ